MIGVIPNSTTLRISIPKQVPWKSQVGIENVGLCPSQIFAISFEVANASSKPPAPTNRVTPGAATIAIAPTPTVSVIALSPTSGFPSSSLKPVK